ncbi:MAG: hypothetical protein HQK49_11855 [Oligoflexia bacterium]|nr:hypothetical protein [Oligoflexia bacterium]
MIEILSNIASISRIIILVLTVIIIITNTNTLILGPTPTLALALPLEEPIKKINFAGYTWIVKNKKKHPAGPGGNFFSDEKDSVWVDNKGWLHLTIKLKNGRWYCSEIYSEKVLGHGTYLFKFAPHFTNWDKNLVLGMFTWDGVSDTSTINSNREIDIEISTWGVESTLNSLYTLQPTDYRGERNGISFSLDTNNKEDIYHGLNWEKNQILFFSFYDYDGYNPQIGRPIQNKIQKEWRYLGPLNPPANDRQQIRINFWLFKGIPPSDGLEKEIIVKDFFFIPIRAI